MLKIIKFILMTILICILFGIGVYAEEKPDTNDSLKIEIKTDKDEYPVNDEISFYITINNPAYYSVSDLTVDCLFSEGFKLTENGAGKVSFDLLGAGEQISFTVTGKYSSANLAFLIVAAIILTFILVFAVLFILKRRKTKTTVASLTIISLFTVMYFSALQTVSAEALNQPNALHESYTVKAGGREVTCEVTVNYNFNEAMTNWNFLGGEWKMNEDQTDVSSIKLETAIQNSEAPNNFLYQGEIFINDSGTAGLLFRCKENEDGSVNGYYFGADIATQKVSFYKIFKNKRTLIADKKLTLNSETWYTVRIESQRERFICYWNNNKNDTDPYPQLDVYDGAYWSGNTGMQSKNGSSFRCLSLEEYSIPSLDFSYKNPLQDNCADPFVLYHEGIYYLYGTTADNGIKVFTSENMAYWKDEGLALKSSDSWGNKWFWAPEVVLKDGIFYMYYSVEEHLCVATSDSPLGPFKQEKKEPFHLNIKEIDSHVFLDDDGKYYMYFVRFGGGNIIWGAELNDDMSSIKEETLVRLLTPSADWEKTMASINEGPFMLKHEGLYYLTYSGDHYQSPGYGVGYAVSESPLGKYVKHTNNPIMQSNEQVHGTGHHSFVSSPDGTELFMVYHSHYDLNNANPRRTCIDRAKFIPVDGFPDELVVYGPTISPQKLPSGSVK